MATYSQHSNLEVASRPSAHEKPPAFVTTTSMAGQNAPQQQYFPGPGPENGGVKGVEKEKTICGVRPATFWLSLALAVLIIAGAVGGGIGGRLVAKKIRENNPQSDFSNSDSSSSSNSDASNDNSNSNNNNANRITITRTTTATADTTTQTTDIVVPTAGFTRLDCPSLNGDTIRGFSSSFRVTCGSDSPGPNIVAIVAYSIQDCARACETYNENLPWHTGADKCVGATFNSYLAYVDAHKGTCWLKSSMDGAVVDGLPGVKPNTYAQVTLL